jgi:hypothetical protein
MPRVKPKQRFDDDTIVVAWQAFASDIEGTPYTIARGTRLRGGHPAVRACPAYFTEDGTPAEEMPVMDVPVPQHEPTTRSPEPIAEDDAVVADVAFNVTGRGHFAKGTRLRRDDPLVKANPHLFRELGRRLVE